MSLQCTNLHLALGGSFAQAQQRDRGQQQQAVGGRSAWFVGVLLLMVYLIFAMTLYMLPPLEA